MGRVRKKSQQPGASTSAAKAEISRSTGGFEPMPREEGLFVSLFPAFEVPFLYKLLSGEGGTVLESRQKEASVLSVVEYS